MLGLIAHGHLVSVLCTVSRSVNVQIVKVLLWSKFQNHEDANFFNVCISSFDLTELSLHECGARIAQTK